MLVAGRCGRKIERQLSRIDKSSKSGEVFERVIYVQKERMFTE